MLDGKPCFCKRDIQLFLKRLRSSVKQKYNISDGIKYFIVSEYGGQFGRPHYHGIFYNLPPHLNLIQQNELIQDNWKNGFVSVFATTPKCLGYVCKYCLQNIQSRNAYSHEDFAPFCLLLAGLLWEAVTLLPLTLLFIFSTEHLKQLYTVQRLFFPVT